jgi:hypothetical protein
MNKAEEEMFEAWSYQIRDMWREMCRKELEQKQKSHPNNLFSEKEYKQIMKKRVDN